MTDFLTRLGVSDVHSGAGTGVWLSCRGPLLDLISPADGTFLGTVRTAGKEELGEVISAAEHAFRQWNAVPAPKRGEVVRRIGNELRRHKTDLGALVSLETGKIRAEGEGEVQEMIDICEFAVGQSRMLYGLSMHSERPRHRIYEQWHPLGPVGVITAFNFPVAVWSWNAMIALVAGDTVVWKPSSKAVMSAVAVMRIAGRVIEEEGLPHGLLNLVVGSGEDVGEGLAGDPRVPLVSVTGSVPMGRRVSRIVAERLGRSILELGGNNGVIITPSADLNLTLRAVLFGAVGTAGQRCTTIRRAFIHRDIYDGFTKALTEAYRKIPIGHPLDPGTLMGPLIDRHAVDRMQEALAAVSTQGGRVLYGGGPLSGGLFDTGTYVTPCLCEASYEMPVVKEETFAPILYLLKYDTLEEAVHRHNDVPQGLASAVFTNDLREAEFFLSHQGSDCGIANVNIGTSGAEIGGAFGGEKDTGGGREAGSDAWKGYMRRQTCTINWSGELPLAQGIRFEWPAS